MRRYLVALSFPLLLISCVPSPADKPSQAPVAEKPAVLQDQALRDLWAGVEGVVIAAGEQLRISYPNDVLFSAAALLSMPGGIAQLDTLVRNIKASGRNWLLLVRAQSGEGEEYDRTLAAGRVKVLQTYFADAGLPSRQIQLQVDPNPGAPLELRLAQSKTEFISP